MYKQRNKFLPYLYITLSLLVIASIANAFISFQTLNNLYEFHPQIIDSLNDISINLTNNQTTTNNSLAELQNTAEDLRLFIEKFRTTTYMLSILFIILVVFVSILLLLEKNEERYQFQNISNLVERRIRLARDEAKIEAMRSIASAFVNNNDVLSNIIRWLEKYKNGDAGLDEAARNQNRIFEVVRKQTRLVQVSDFGLIVNYDPQIHNTDDQLFPGEKAIVIEPGWRISKEIVKMPIVRRIK